MKSITFALLVITLSAFFSGCNKTFPKKSINKKHNGNNQQVSVEKSQPENPPQVPTTPEKTKEKPKQDETKEEETATPGIPNQSQNPVVPTNDEVNDPEAEEQPASNKEMKPSNDVSKGKNFHNHDSLKKEAQSREEQLGEALKGTILDKYDPLIKDNYGIAWMIIKSIEGLKETKIDDEIEPHLIILKRILEAQDEGFKESIQSILSLVKYAKEQLAQSYYKDFLELKFQNEKGDEVNSLEFTEGLKEGIKCEDKEINEISLEYIDKLKTGDDQKLSSTLMEIIVLALDKGYDDKILAQYNNLVNKAFEYPKLSCTLAQIGYKSSNSTVCSSSLDLFIYEHNDCFEDALDAAQEVLENTKEDHLRNKAVELFKVLITNEKNDQNLALTRATKIIEEDCATGWKESFKSIFTTIEKKCNYSAFYELRRFIEKNQ